MKKTRFIDVRTIVSNCLEIRMGKGDKKYPGVYNLSGKRIGYYRPRKIAEYFTDVANGRN